MIHYNENILIVTQTICRYGYSQHAVKWSDNCFSQLKLWTEGHGIHVFNGEKALSWVEGQSVPTRYKRFFRSAVQRLIDVYETGAVMRKHLVFYSRILPSNFTKARDGYLSSIGNSFSQRQLRNISDACNRFLGFLYVGGIDSLDQINYHTMPLYYQDIMLQNQTPGIQADIVEGFLFYLARQGICSYGLGWYMLYFRSGKDPCSINFTPSHVSGLSGGGTQHQCTAEQMRQKIPPFLEKLQGYRYSATVLSTSEAALKLLFIVLDMSDALYTTALADKWIASEGRRLFKSSFEMARRGVELFDGYLKAGSVNPYIWKKRNQPEMDRLPEWCRMAVSRFMKQKAKEGKSPKTVSGYRCACTKFCQFLIEKGVTEFNAITPELVKEFNLLDHHRTVKGKSGFNGLIRKFLSFLYREGLHSQPGLPFALPGTSASGGRIIDVLTEDEKKQIQRHKENASSPLELRDAAVIELGLKMGFRGKDIIDLKFQDIDWRSHTIRLIQSKTGVEIRLPMGNSVGNAIYRYLKEGRPPVAGDPHVFLKTRAPFGPVSSSVCRHAMGRVLPGRNTPGSGFHAVRRTFATDLLRKGTKISLIADALGHSDTGTVHKYISLDEERMRLCPLSLMECGLMPEGRGSHE